MLSKGHHTLRTRSCTSACAAGARIAEPTAERLGLNRPHFDRKFTSTPHNHLSRTRDNLRQPGWPGRAVFVPSWWFPVTDLVPRKQGPRRRRAPFDSRRRCAARSGQAPTARAGPCHLSSNAAEPQPKSPVGAVSHGMATCCLPSANCGQRRRSAFSGQQTAFSTQRQGAAAMVTSGSFGQAATPRAPTGRCSLTPDT